MITHQHHENTSDLHENPLLQDLQTVPLLEAKVAFVSGLIVVQRNGNGHA